MAPSADPPRVGLRVDVDTLRGTRLGVPALLEILQRHGVRATFFFSVGPDNMGRHLWRLLRPAFLAKMLRSNAPGLYGWDILLRGTLWSGPRIGRACAEVIRAAAAAHEVGLHAWDHHRWQSRMERMSPAEIEQDVRTGLEEIARILGRPVACSAVAGWKCNQAVLREKEKFALTYNSDCRGRSVFRPRIDGRAGTPQVPVTLPTYDELIGRDGITDENYNEHLLALIRPGQLNVLTIHAEVEGIARRRLFEDFLDLARDRRIRLAPLADLLPDPAAVPEGTVELGTLEGREGTLCRQA